MFFRAVIECVDFCDLPLGLNDLSFDDLDPDVTLDDFRCDLIIIFFCKSRVSS